MEWLDKLIALVRDPGQIALAGYPVLALIIFLETGALVFFLPGDSLLITAGVYAARGFLDVALLNLILIPCAVLGDATSYLIGARTGPHLFTRPRSRFFRPEHVQAAHAFYEKHGGKAIILARFMPLVRTFVPVIAGVAKMPYRRFAFYNVIGGGLWVLSMTLLGYFVGVSFPGVVKHMEVVILVVVFVSILPALFAWWRGRAPSAKDGTT